MPTHFTGSQLLCVSVGLNNFKSFILDVAEIYLQVNICCRMLSGCPSPHYLVFSLRLFSFVDWTLSQPGALCRPSFLTDAAPESALAWKIWLDMKSNCTKNTTAAAFNPGQAEAEDFWNLIQSVSPFACSQFTTKLQHTPCLQWPQACTNKAVSAHTPNEQAAGATNREHTYFFDAQGKERLVFLSSP